MDLSPSGATFVRLEEGVELKFYLDAVGVGTIGIGFTWGSAAFRQWWAANKPGIKFGPGATMTRDEADQALITCFAKEYGKAVNTFLGHDVPQNVFDGMASPVYNLGTGSLQWHWAAFAKTGNYQACAEALRITGTTAKGKTLAGLVRRRKDEANLIANGIYAGVAQTPPATHDPVDTAMLDSVLTRGERGPSVASPLTEPAELGYYHGKLDDVFGYGTEAAVLAFQRDHGLQADGYAGEKTLAAINAALVPKTAPASPATAPQSAPAPVLFPDKPGVTVIVQQGDKPPVITEQTAPAPTVPAPPPRSSKPTVAVGILAVIGTAITMRWHELAAWIHSFF